MVTWQVTRLPAHAAMLAALWCAATVAHGAWWMQAAPEGWRYWVALAVLIGSGLMATTAWMRVRAGTLQWGGRNWAWAADGGPAVQVALTADADFQWLLLLRFRATTGARCWFWVAQARDRAHWLAFRRAIFARSGADPDSDWPTAGPLPQQSTPR